MTAYNAIVLTAWSAIVLALVAFTVFAVAIVIRDIRSLDEPDEHADIDRYWAEGQQAPGDKSDLWAEAEKVEANSKWRPYHWAEGADGSQFDE